MTNSKILHVRSATTWTSGVASVSTIRNFAPIIMDEPTSLGGQDTGANPLEYLTAALNGCKAVMIPLIAQELKFEFTALRFETHGTIDLRGLYGVAGISSHFQTLSFIVYIETDESEQRLNQLKNLVATRCPIYNLIKDAGVKIETVWHRQSIAAVV